MERVRIPEKMLLGQTSYADFSFGLGVVCGSKSVQSMEGWGSRIESIPPNNPNPAFDQSEAILNCFTCCTTPQKQELQLCLDRFRDSN